MKQSDFQQHLHFASPKQELLEIEEQSKSYLPFFDQVLESLQSPDRSAISDFCYLTPQPFTIREENTIRLEENVTQELQQFSLAIHQQAKTDKENCRQTKGKVEQNFCRQNQNYLPQNCQKKTYSCFSTNKAGQSQKCRCKEKSHQPNKNTKKYVMVPFWSIEDQL